MLQQTINVVPNLRSQSDDFRLVIQQPYTCAMPISFDWSDFPIVQRDEFLMQSPTVFKTASKDQSLEEALDVSSSDSDTDCSTNSSSSISTAAKAAATVPNVTPKSHVRKVSFSNVQHVRTHSVVLGEHPCCPQLAMELGWDFEETQMNLPSSTSQDEHMMFSGRRRRGHGPRPKTYFERRQILKDVGGLTDEEIRQTTLRHASPSMRDLSAMQGITI